MPAPRGLYVHVPWCRRRCPYCDFYFEVGQSDEAFAQALAQELSQRRDALSSPFDTLYLGGGTPSALGPEAVASVFAVLFEHATWAASAEVTLEANPEDIEPALLDAWRRAGVNRVSLGAQSFDDGTLRRLGRGHRGAQAEAAVQMCRAAGFRISVDVIIGVPGDAPGREQTDVQRAVAAGAEHISTYMLTVEPGTPLAARIEAKKAAAVDDDAQADAYERVRTEAGRLGLLQYEVSSFARPGQESRHNRVYWGKGPYVGLGPSAHSLAWQDDGSVVRRQNVASWAAYRDQPTFETETLSPDEAFLEAVAFGLRDVGTGVDVDALAARHRAPAAAAVRAVLSKMTEGPDAHLQRRGARLVLTRRGVLFADAVARAVLGVEPMVPLKQG